MTQMKTDVIDFVERGVLGESSHQLYPVQRVVLKAMYGIPLDDTTPNVPIYRGKWRRTGERMLTEADYLKFLADDGRANVDTIEEGQYFASVNVSKGRRSGGSFLSSLILAYELYSLLREHESPQRHFGMPDTQVICLMAISCNKDMAGNLRDTTRGHLSKVRWLEQLRANETQTYTSYLTQHDEARMEADADATIYNSSTVRLAYRTAVAKGLRGNANKTVLAEEYAFFHDAMEVRNAVIPSTYGFGAEGRMVAISSPNGQQLDQRGETRCPFYAEFKRSMEGAAGALCLQIPTWELNPMFDPELLEQFHNETSTARFDAEWGARFVREG